MNAEQNRVLDNFLKVDEETWDNRDGVLQNDAVNIMDVTCEKLVYFKENGNEKDSCI